ncbi:hypothetical protein Mgra_00009152 [Meloidogyne graminicola]|uniref:Uncharacterized protein n=1 Tax=Meloidogyne graminicola TaxID=189291 RepID=A0A8S9ZDP9_9BILA|nr:hypothetical protein Mgra_00009152 [Meloidogyne graminicola]
MEFSLFFYMKEKKIIFPQFLSFIFPLYNYYLMQTKIADFTQIIKKDKIFGFLIYMKLLFDYKYK